MEWICEWCDPKEVEQIVAEFPEKCRILYCNKHDCKTWHGPKSTAAFNSTSQERMSR